MYQTSTPTQRGFRPPSGLHAAGLLGLAVFLSLTGCASSPRAATTASAASVDPTTGSRPAGDVYATAVQALTSSDFDTRARAARTLVAAGDASLPALGRAGELLVRPARGTEVSATRSVLDTVLTHSEDQQLARHLQSPWPNVRRAAAEELGRRDRWGAIPALIGRLDDRTPEVRSASVSSLRRITNNFFGYRATASLGHRQATVRRWNTWWSQEGRAKAAERGPKLLSDRD